MTTFLSFLLLCFVGSFWFHRRSWLLRGAFVAGAALVVCLAYYALHVL